MDVPHPEPSSLLPPHTIPLGHPSAPAPIIQYRASNLDWQLVSYMIFYMFQCHSPKSSHPLPIFKFNFWHFINKKECIQPLLIDLITRTWTIKFLFQLTFTQDNYCILIILVNHLFLKLNLRDILKSFLFLLNYLISFSQVSRGRDLPKITFN